MTERNKDSAEAFKKRSEQLIKSWHQKITYETDKTKKMNLYNLIGAKHYQLGDLENSKTNFVKSLKIFQGTRHKDSTTKHHGCKTLSYLCQIYQKQKNQENFRTCSNMLLKYSEELNDAIHFFNSFRFRAIIRYQEAEKLLEDEKEAEDYFRKRDLQAEFENTLKDSVSLFEKAGQHLETYKKQDLENSK